VSSLVANKYRKGTGTNISFPTLPNLTVQPRRIDLFQKQYAHDVLMLEYKADSSLWTDNLHTGVPVQFIWKQDTFVKNWIGYVSSISKAVSPDRLNTMKVLCVSGSFPLKERATRVFLETTIPEAVRTIAAEYGFTFIGENNDQKFSQLTIAGSSYWDWIQEQAKRIGYGVLIDGMNFMFRPLDKLIDQGFSSTAVLSLGNASIPFNTQYLDRTLDQFIVMSGDNVEDTTEFRAVKNVGGVDPVSAAEYLSSESPDTVGTNIREDVSSVLFSEYRTDRVINDAVSAKSASAGAAQMARFNLPAAVKCQGDPRIRPFGTVYISGTGNVTDGFWVVRESHHMFHQVGDYIMELKIATDGLGDTSETPFRTRPDTNIGTVNLDEALKNNGVPSLFFDLGSVVLSSRQAVVKQGAQGFTKTPTKWRAVGA